MSFVGGSISSIGTGWLAGRVGWSCSDRGIVHVSSSLFQNTRKTKGRGCVVDNEYLAKGSNRALAMAVYLSITSCHESGANLTQGNNASSARQHLSLFRGRP